MHIGLNLVFLVPGETGGMETYARELIVALKDQAPDVRLTAFLGREAAADTSAPWAEIPSIVVPVDARRRPQWVRGEQLLLPRLAQREGVDLVHSLASTAPAHGRFRRVVTIHDVIYRIYPEAHSGLHAKGMRLLVPLAARRSQRIIAPSGKTRDDLVKLLGIGLQKIDVVPEGVSAPPATGDGQRVRTRLRLGDRPIALTLSAFRPHKNVGRLLEALALIPVDARPVLLLPGYATRWEADLRQQARALGLEQDVHFLGWVPDEEIEDLYAAANCFVFPSLYEGFGLPVLEAMSRGVPVACSDRGSLREVAGDAALRFDPEKPGAIASAIESLLTGRAERERLAALGRAQAARFSWLETARLTVDTYRRALE